MKLTELVLKRHFKKDGLAQLSDHTVSVLSTNILTCTFQSLVTGLRGRGFREIKDT